jgi:molecular chaperone GrpE
MTINDDQKELEAPEEKDLLDNPDQLLIVCEQEREEYLNGWKRAKADLINHQKEEVKRLESVARLTREEIIENILPALESFELALQSAESDSMSEGFQRVRDQLTEALKRHGLEEIPVTPGQVFDPNFHEAIAEVKSDLPSGAIAEEIRKGYAINGKTIKAAQVRISR